MQWGDTILLPKFETGKMVTRAQRKIGSKTARQMLTWSHYRFQQRLINKTREYRKSQVIICDEAYTSMTCGRRGELHEKLGGSKTFRCPHCGVTMDRDMNGSRHEWSEKHLASIFDITSRSSFEGRRWVLAPAVLKNTACRTC